MRLAPAPPLRTTPLAGLEPLGVNGEGAGDALPPKGAAGRDAELNAADAGRKPGGPIGGVAPAPLPRDSGGAAGGAARGAARGDAPGRLHTGREAAAARPLPTADGGR